jgi:RNA polymerase sigma factor (sigma-70 family)
MEVSSLRQGTLPGRPAPSPLLRLASDERLVTLIRRGHHAAFEALVHRYQARLLSFCRHMLGSREDAEDVLQDVFAAAFNAILADDREINVRPWLYRIARNRNLNHLRRTTAIGVDSMDTYFADHGQSVPERILQRESFQGLIDDIGRLAETQRTALLLREIDALSYEQIAEVMDTTVPSVKSLLVRARVALAEAAEARKLSCEEVRIELGEVAEGLLKMGPPIRRHLRDCPRCRSFNKQLKQNERALAAVLPIAGLPALLHRLVATKLGSTTGAGGAYAAGGGAGAGASAGTGASLAAGAGATSGISGVGGAAGVGSGAIAAKAVAGLAAAALVTAGAVEIGHSRTVVRRPAGSASAQGLSHATAPTVLSSAPQIPTAAHARAAAVAAHITRKTPPPQLNHSSVVPPSAPTKPQPPVGKHATTPATAAKHAIPAIPASAPRPTTAHDSTTPASSQVVEVASSTVELPSSSAEPTDSSASAPAASPSPAASTEKPLTDSQAGPSGASGPTGPGADTGPTEATTFGGHEGRAPLPATDTGGSPAPEQSSDQPAGGPSEAPAGGSETSPAG